jgi:Sodium/calcium exchanger protein
MGNVVGSNVANIGLILGACALVVPIPVARGVLRFEYPFLVLASWIALLLCRDGRLDRLEGAFFLASMVAFTAYAVWVARREITAPEKSLVGEVVPDRAAPLSRRPTWALIVDIFAALLGLVLGAQALVSAAVSLARAVGVSERVVGLTIVSVGHVLARARGELRGGASQTAGDGGGQRSGLEHLQPADDPWRGGRGASDAGGPTYDLRRPVGDAELHVAALSIGVPQRAAHSRTWRLPPRGGVRLLRRLARLDCSSARAPPRFRHGRRTQ